MTRPRVLLADDHRLLREAFAQLLEPECDMVGAVADLIDICRAADHWGRSHGRATTAVADVARALAQRGPRDDDELAEGAA